MYATPSNLSNGWASAAPTMQRLLEIEKSRHLGLDTNRLTLEQARRIRWAIDVRQAELNVKTTAA